MADSIGIEFRLIQVEKALLAIQKHHKKKLSKNILCDNVVKAFFTFKKLPFVINKTTSLESHLPCSFLDRKTTSICLLTKDIDKKYKRNIESTINYFKEYLSTDKNVEGVDEIISFKQLKMEYKTFEARRKLCSAYDVFLVDDRIAPLVGPYLGRSFVESNKLPFSIKLTKGNINNHIDKCLSISRTTITPTSSRCCFKFGSLDQPVDQLLLNFRAVIDAIDKSLPGKLANVRTICISVNDWPLLPVYASTGSANEVKFEPTKSKNKRGLIVCNIDSFNEPRKLTMYPSGRIKISTRDPTKTAKPSRTKRVVKQIWRNALRHSRRIKKYLSDKFDDKPKQTTKRKLSSRREAKRTTKKAKLEPMLEIKNEIQTV